MHEKVAYLENLLCTSDCKKNQASCENGVVVVPRTLPTASFEEAVHTS